MREVPADQLPDQEAPRTWWGSGSWPALRWQRSYPPNCARITWSQRARSRRLSCPPGTWAMSVSLLAACPSPHAVTTSGHFPRSPAGSPGRDQRAALRFTLLLAAGSAIFASNRYPPHISEAPPFNPVIYTLDLLLPVISLGQAGPFPPTGFEQWVSYLLVAAGWLLASTIAPRLHASSGGNDLASAKYHPPADCVRGFR